MASAFLCEESPRALEHIRLICGFCESEFLAAGPRPFCSKSCRDKRRRRTQPRLRPHSRRCICKACRSPFYSVNESKKKFCSPQCKAGWRDIQVRACARIYKPRRVAPLPPREFACDHCGERHVCAPGDRAKRYCTLACSKAAQRQRSIRSGERSAQRRARKLRLRGVTTETVNPIAVLDRDRWTCQLCGVRTPKHLRGAFDDRAPEVDHIIPLSKGGEHSYRNVQCTCRKCNLLKAGKPQGQLRLFG